MKLSFLLDGLVKETISETEINSISYNPKECDEGDLLFLLNDRAKNEYTMLSPKASAIVIESPFPHDSSIPVYTVSNIRDALSKACSRLYCKNLSGIKFIGITGTNGKSTTAIILEKILSDYGYEVGYIGTGKIRAQGELISGKYYSMTTPPPDLLYRSIGKMEHMGVKIIVMEVSSHALDQERVSPINFEIGIFTNLSEEHLDYHKSINNYFRSKKKLFEKSNLIIVNSDDLHGKTVLDEYTNAEGCGSLFYTNVQISNVNNLGFSGSKFNYRSNKNNVNIKLPLPGTYNVYNAMLAIRAAEILGIPITSIKKSLKETEKIDGRFNVIDCSIKVVIDYAHTVSAFDNLLKNLNSIKNSGQNLAVVFGCGGDRDKGKRGRMGEIAEKYADRIIVTSDNPRGEDPWLIIEDITKPMKTHPTIMVDRKDAIRYAIISANDGDLVSIVGKGPENYSISQGVYSSFDEAEIIHNALRERHKCE